MKYVSTRHLALLLVTPIPLIKVVTPLLPLHFSTVFVPSFHHCNLTLGASLCSPLECYHQLFRVSPSASAPHFLQPATLPCRFFFVSRTKASLCTTNCSPRGCYAFRNSGCHFLNSTEII